MTFVSRDSRGTQISVGNPEYEAAKAKAKECLVSEYS